MGPLLEGLIEYGKTQRIICSANAAGGATHMLAKAFFGEAGVDCEVLAADSGAQNALAVASGDAVCAIVAASAATQYIEDGSLKALACFSPEPFTGYECLTIPTVKDMGYGEYFATNQEYIRKYRFCNAFHPFHGFSMMSCGHIAEMNTSSRRPWRTPRRNLLVPTPTSWLCPRPSSWAPSICA